MYCSTFRLPAEIAFAKTWIHIADYNLRLSLHVLSLDILSSFLGRSGWNSTIRSAGHWALPWLHVLPKFVKTYVMEGGCSVGRQVVHKCIRCGCDFAIIIETVLCAIPRWLIWEQHFSQSDSRVLRVISYMKGGHSTTDTQQSQKQKGLNQNDKNGDTRQIPATTSNHPAHTTTQQTMGLHNRGESQSMEGGKRRRKRKRKEKRCDHTPPSNPSRPNRKTRHTYTQMEKREETKGRGIRKTQQTKFSVQISFPI